MQTGDDGAAGVSTRVTRILSARGIEVRYPGPERAALAGVDLCVAPGEVVAVGGENGSGKSTLCLALAGAIAPMRGSVAVDGEPLDGPAPGAIQLIQQHAEDQVVSPVVRDDVAFGPECIGLAEAEVAERVREALATVGLAGFESREVATLSGGELARLALAGVLAMRPAYVVADEPTAQLDAGSADRLMALLRTLADRGTGVLVATHRLEDARHADRLVLLRAGEITAEGAPRELLYDEALLRSCGLTPPPIVSLVRAWRAAGRPVEGTPLSVDELVEAACLSLR